ncbi:MAG: hypothetical protein HRU01_04240 [Myxococcales bacterium]|nr:hypothetical protein [Myxococcales bacterium]
MQRFTTTLCAIALTLSVAGQSALGAETDRPAVKEFNYRTSFTYSFGSKYGGSTESVPPGETVLIPDISVHAWSFGGGVTVPLGNSFGGHAFLIGGKAYSQLEYTELGANQIANFDFGKVEVGSTAFWRDPDRGFLELGYSYFNILDVSHRHSLLSAAGLYVNSIDFTIGFQYGSDSTTSADPRRERNLYALYGAATWYFSNHVAVRAGLGWEKSSTPSISEAESESIDGGAEILWQPTLGPQRHRYLTLNLALGGGRTEYQIPGFPDPSLNFVEVFVGLTFDHTDADSLLELFREYR